MSLGTLKSNKCIATTIFKVYIKYKYDNKILQSVLIIKNNNQY